MTDVELKALLRSLPSVKAPENLEENLYTSIAQRSDQFPHVLGTLPLVPAHEDFDARLMQAIRERRHPVGPLPGAISGGTIPWFAAAGARWFTGAVAVVGLLVVALNISHVDPQLQAPATRVANVVAAPTVSSPDIVAALRGSIVLPSAIVTGTEAAESSQGVTSEVASDQIHVAETGNDARRASAVVNPPTATAPRLNTPSLPLQTPSATSFTVPVPTSSASTATNRGTAAAAPVNPPMPDGSTGVDTPSVHPRDTVLSPSAVVPEEGSKNDGTVNTGGNTNTDDSRSTGPNM